MKANGSTASILKTLARTTGQLKRFGNTFVVVRDSLLKSFDECDTHPSRAFGDLEDSENHAQNILSWQILPRLRSFLTLDCPENLIFETLWVITNIAAGPTVHTSAIVENEFLPLLNQLLIHPSGGVRTQATWSIGNIVGDREGYRDVVLQNCCLSAILHIWQGEFPDESSRKEAFRISMWVVDNMCRYRPDWHLMEPAFTIIPDYLKHDDPLLLKECCWAVARIFHGAGRYTAIDNMITPELCHRLMTILS